MTESTASLRSADAALSAVKVAIDQSIKSERERCAVICEMMIVRGRAWTEQQANAAEILEAAATNIRNPNNRPHLAFTVTP